MRSVPVDMGRFLSARCASDPEPKANFESGEIDKDRATGLPIWTVGVTVRVPGEKKPQVIEVRVVGEKPPTVVEGERLVITDLVTSLWEQNGRAGLTFRAASVTAVPATAAAGSATGPGSVRSAGKGGESS